jgi:2,4-dienoyl-CoA reductase-like NADH-dependent reductase (Old Yellow Enzyme family)
MPHLFDSFTLRGVTLRNRVGVSPMCQYSSEDGLATDWHLVHIGSRAVGGAGLVMVEDTAVEPRGRITPQDMGIWADKHVAPLERIARFVAGQGAAPGIQLGHAGRKASVYRPWGADRPGGNGRVAKVDSSDPVPEEHGGWDVVAPSPIPFHEGQRAPKELTKEEIAVVRAAFRAGAARAREAGFVWLELHAAHGYLSHSFHSPLSNERKDEYGGSFENRTRFTLETVRAVRAEWPDDKPLAVRLSCTDWVEGGWTLEESVELAGRLKAEGVDLVDCSSGGLTPHASIPIKPGYQVPFSEAVRAGAEVPTAAVGLITEPEQADEIVRDGRADVVLLGREMLRDPYWTLRAARVVQRWDGALVPPQYGRIF